LPTANVNGINIYYETSGSGEPLLLITGLGGSVVDWHYQIPELSQHFQVIAIENRGAGRSDKPREHSMALYAADCAGLLDHLDTASAHVYGISMGGMIAQQLALDFPQKVHSLVLGATTPCPFGWPIDPSTLTKFAGAFGSSMSPEGMATAGLPIGYSERFIVENINELRRLIKLQAPYVAPLKQWGRQLKSVIRFDVRKQLKKIKVPTLILQGENDPIISRGCCKYLAKHISKARLVLFPNGRHAFNIEFRKQANSVVIDFIKSVSSRVA